MKEFFLLVAGIGIGYWLANKSSERDRLKSENDLLRSKLKDINNKE